MAFRIYFYLYARKGLAEHTVFVCSGGRKLLHVTKRSLESGDIQVVHAGELNAYIDGSASMPEYSDADLFVSCYDFVLFFGWLIYKHMINDRF